MSDELAGKVAVITGETSGIGLASVEAFVAAGARVVVGSLRTELGAPLIEHLGDRMLFLQTDVNRVAEIAELVQHDVDRQGKLDVMFNNAGIGGDLSSILDIEPRAPEGRSSLRLANPDFRAARQRSATPLPSKR
ncbi:MAG: SDR family NAD(P)-dependent oxidoreductase [Microbacteriaceae bacterium]|nr:SDR family NAD(P)-dependent oxidoreductase [Microbacteriaceae bacterium]